jgi:imidazolonepropionase-like amidohydrolase
MSQRHRPKSLIPLFLMALSIPSVRAEETLAVRCGRLLDPAHQRVLENAVVLVQQGRIRSVGTGDQVPAGARVIRLDGMTVLPGLIDAHTHLLLQGDVTAEDYDAQLLKESIPYRALRAAKAAGIALSHGFTTLRDIGNEGAGYADVDLKRAFSNDVLPGPHLFVATRALAPTGAYPLHGYAWELKVPIGVENCDGAEGCRKAVRDQAEHGADWIKVYADRSYRRQADGVWKSIPNFTPEEMKAIVDESHRLGKKVAAHSMTPSGHQVALGAGVDSIEHGDVLDDASIRTMVRRHVYLCPTLSVTAFVAPGRSKTNRVWVDLLEASKRSFRKALAAGVPIAFGTDAGGFDWDKVNQAEEFRRMVDLGMTPWQAIRSATIVAAEMLGEEGRLGTVSPGSHADLIAVRGNPLSDISVLERDVAWVMLDGKIVFSASPSLESLRPAP